MSKIKTKNKTGRKTIAEAISASKQAEILWKDFIENKK